MEYRLPQEKIYKVNKALASSKHRKKLKSRELQSLIGLLNMSMTFYDSLFWFPNFNMNNVSFIHQIKGNKNTLWQQMKNLFEISFYND
jgi:hypothetical protein